MATRGLFGKRYGAYGGWISKPGVDVLSASPGQFLLDTNSQVYQTVAKGVTQLLAVQNAACAPGSYVYAEALPAEFAPYSNLALSTVLYQNGPSIGTRSGDLITTRRLMARVTAGVLYMTLYLPAQEGPVPNAANWYTYFCAWTIFRAQF